MPQPDLTPGRRIRAAMQLAGIESFGELARIVNTRNLGERTLRKIADDSDQSRNLQRLDAVAIAEATGLPVSFFVAPSDALLDAIGRAGETSGTDVAERDQLAERVTTLEQALADVERQRQADLASLAEELARQVSLALETGVLPTSEADAAKGSRAADA